MCNFDNGAHLMHIVNTSPPSFAPFPKSDYADSASKSKTMAPSPSIGSSATTVAFLPILPSSFYW
ncbi:hypothetical protein CRYUN_Cryun19dG0106400 [Craigia yunnanensis]